MDRSRGRPRRFQHAHPVRQPVGAIDGRASLRLGRRRRRLGPGGASIFGLAMVALGAALLRPWDGGPLGGSTGGPAAEPHSAAPAAPGNHANPAAGRDTGNAPSPRPTLGPHGDTVTGSTPEDPVAGRRATGLLGRPSPLPPALLDGYQWPVRNARITNTYGLGRPSSFHVGGVPFHDGIDVSSFCGARITAAHDGVVLVASRRHHAYQGWVGDLGPFIAKMDDERAWRSQAITVVVDDGNGYRSVYAHLGLAAVEKGEVVKAGDLIGWEGASGNATGCHLHYALFSPLETDLLALDPKIAKKTKLPAYEVARIDPLLVFPPPAEAGISWNWGSR